MIEKLPNAKEMFAIGLTTATLLAGVVEVEYADAAKKHRTGGVGVEFVPKKNQGAKHTGGMGVSRGGTYSVMGGITAQEKDL